MAKKRNQPTRRQLSNDGSSVLGLSLEDRSVTSGYRLANPRQAEPYTKRRSFTAKAYANSSFTMVLMVVGDLLCIPVLIYILREIDPLAIFKTQYLFGSVQNYHIVALLLVTYLAMILLHSPWKRR